MGAGRVSLQGLRQISHAIESGEFYANPALVEAFRAAEASGGAVHVYGLVSDGGVHSHMDHAKALVEMGGKLGCRRLFVHVFTDGRDTAPDSGLGYVADLEAFLRAQGLGRIATVSGRYYSMDRDRRWERTERAYEALVRGAGKHAASVGDAIRASYDAGETDEFIQPTVIQEDGRPVATLSDGDSVIFFNFRADRARQITRALTEDGFAEFPVSDRPDLSSYACFMKYDDGFSLPVAFEKVRPDQVVGQVLSRHGIPQLRCAETEKYAHVTYFFNGGREEAFAGEARLLIPSSKVATYDLKPEMSAYEVAEGAIQALRGTQGLILVLNFANADMVGHTGHFEAAVQACRVADECVGKVMKAVFDLGGSAIITADHGNAETMVHPETKEPHTAHTVNPVRAILAGDLFRGSTTYPRGLIPMVSPEARGQTLGPLRQQGWSSAVVGLRSPLPNSMVRSRLGAALLRSLQDLTSVLLPPACCVCDEIRDARGECGVCARCWARVEFLAGPICPCCGRPHSDLEDDDFEGVLCGGCLARKPPFHAGVSMGHYRGTLKALIRLFKFADRPDLARPLAVRAATLLRHRGLVADVDRIVPVPLPLPRRLRRGYNQATVLAREMGRLLEIPLDARALRRRGRGRPQTSLPAKRRRTNVRGAFRLRWPDGVEDQSLLLVDDVWTTGATLAECSRVLRRGGARQVTVFSLARTPESFDLEPHGGLD
jgi:2,3-bisphosphoglycerate-independent phosphoglycerate mutase